VSVEGGKHRVKSGEQKAENREYGEKWGIG